MIERVDTFARVKWDFYTTNVSVQEVCIFCDEKRIEVTIIKVFSRNLNGYVLKGRWRYRLNARDQLS